MLAIAIVPVNQQISFLYFRTQEISPATAHPYLVALVTALIDAKMTASVMEKISAAGTVAVIHALHQNDNNDYSC